MVLPVTFVSILRQDKEGNKENQHPQPGDSASSHNPACSSPEPQALALASSSVSRMLQSLQTPASAESDKGDVSKHTYPTRRLNFSPEMSRKATDQQVDRLPGSHADSDSASEQQIAASLQVFVGLANPVLHCFLGMCCCHDHSEPSAAVHCVKMLLSCMDLEPGVSAPFTHLSNDLVNHHH